MIAYGQTGSGKTHTMFGPPGIMARMAAAKPGEDSAKENEAEDPGIFPRGLREILEKVEALRAGGRRAVLTASAVELSMTGNRDMLAADYGKES